MLTRWALRNGTKYTCVKEKKMEQREASAIRSGRSESFTESQALPLAMGEKTHASWSAAWLREDQLFQRMEEGNWTHQEKANNWILAIFKIVLIQLVGNALFESHCYSCKPKEHLCTLSHSSTGQNWALNPGADSCCKALPPYFPARWRIKWGDAWPVVRPVRARSKE